MSERNESVEPHPTGHVKPASSDHAILRHALRVALAVALSLYFIIAALFLGLRYGLLPHVDALRPRIEALVSDKLHVQLRIGRLAAHWSGFQPGIDITGLTIRGRDGQLALSVPHAVATVSWRSLWTLRPVLSALVVERPDVLVARARDGSLTVAGVPVPNTHTGNDTFTTWLLRQQAIVLRGGTLRWRDARHDAPELALHQIRLAILNDGYDHRVALQAPPDGNVLHGPLDFRAHFRHAPLSAPGKPANWHGEAYISTGPVDLPALAHYVNFPIATYAGRVDNAIWIDFADGRMTSASGELSGIDVSLRVRPSQPRLDMPVARFSWQLDLAPDDYTLHLRDLHAELGQLPLADGTPLTRTLSLASLTGRYRRASVQHGQLISVSGDRVDLGVLAEFSRALPLSGRILNTLVHFDPRGQVAHYLIEIERARPESGNAAAGHDASRAEPIVRYRLKADLQGISIAAQEPPPGLTPLGHPRAGLPGVENLWGSIDADQTHGSMTIDTRDAAVTLPGLFDNPRLLFDRLQGRGSWVVKPAAPGEAHKAFTITVPELRAVNADTAARVTADYSNPGHGRGSLDLKAYIEHVQVARIPRYLPTSISAKLRTYLGHSLQAGTARGATIEVHGDLTQFPYSRNPHAGVFRIVAPFTHGRFDPSPYPPRTLRDGTTPNVWPAFDGIDGTFSLAQNVLRFDITHARYKRVALTKVSGRIADLGTKASNLVISGNGRGPLADMLAYVDASALGGVSKHAGRKLHVDGPASLALKLTVPRTPRPHIAVEGALGFGGNRVAVDNVPPLSKLTGTVRFTDQAARLDHLAGEFLGGEVHANGGFVKDGAYSLDLQGRIAADAARGLGLRGPAAQLLARMKGSAPYDLSVTGAKDRLPDISASSDLSDLALDFPAPFDKPAGTPMPLRFTLSPAGPGGSTGTLQRAELTFGPVSASYLLRDAAHGSPHVVVGALGVNRPAVLPNDGVIAAVDIPTFDADAWRALFDKMRGKDAGTDGADSAAGTNSPSGTSGTSAADGAAGAPEMTPDTLFTQFMPTRFALHVGMLTLLKRHWESVIVGASRENGNWQANVASNQVSGHVAWLPGHTPGSPGTVQARLARLVIPATSENDLLGRAISAPARNMPAIDLQVNQLFVHGHDAGHLDVDARNVTEAGVPVWQLDKLELSNPAATLSATGNWRTATRFGANTDEDTPRRTVFDFKLDIKDAGALLARIGLPRTVEGGSGTLAGKVVWRGGPTQIDYPTLNGNVSVDLHHGQILRVDPGVAKLLGVLSLQSLERFATLHFRDVIGKGLPFESVTGTGQISNGIGSTDNFRMVTAPARAEIKGSVDLAQETQDLHVHIVPTISAGAGVVAATVVNPLFGLAALAANFALSKSISKAFAVDYAVTGSWSKPHVERVHDDRGKMALPAFAAPTP
jgi:uncharacterized protein (TIGR02099 family)